MSKDVWDFSVGAILGGLICMTVGFISAEEAEPSSTLPAMCEERLAECWEATPPGCPYPSVCNNHKHLGEVACFREYGECLDE